MTQSVTNIKTTADLITAELVDKSQRNEIATVLDRYACSLTPTLAALINPDDPNDPIAKQFVPSAQELIRFPEERDDAIGDDIKSPVKGIVHRYPDRALLKLVNICPVYCRFCFRREMIGPKHDGMLTPHELCAALDYLKKHKDIWEVILTGGDPLILSPRRIKDITKALSIISHIKVLRWHTRVPIAMPEHVTDDLIVALATSEKTIYVSIHANHARELTPQARDVCKRMASAGINLVSQTVLLKGVNDTAETLCDLMRAFIESEIKPYYLHHPDLAPGTSHFRVPIRNGQSLMRELRQRLSGLAQPTYVLDIPGAHGKVPIGPEYIRTTPTGTHVVIDPMGRHHHYRDLCNTE